MTFSTSLRDLLPDTVTIEPFSAETAARAITYGAAVTYRAQVNHGAKRMIGPGGREVISNVQVLIPERVHVDQRSRVTLPSGFVPQQPPILGIELVRNLGLDHTVISL